MTPPAEPGHLAGPGPLVVLAGIPGAGKTTALRALSAAGELDAARVLDSDDARRLLPPPLTRVRYAVIRPAVHAVHWGRVVGAALGGRGALVVHENATRRWTRAVMLGLARLTGRRAHMVWVEVTAEEARRGQHERARVVPDRAFRRHLERLAREHPAGAAAGTWDGVLVTDRAGAARAVLAAVSGSGPVDRPPARVPAPHGPATVEGRCVRS